jgi:citrate synthase
MTTYVRANEAARILGVAPATLYAYVSRGRVNRTTGPDGRTSLFALDEIEELATRGRATTPTRRPTIDVQITSGVTVLSDDGVRHHGFPLEDLVTCSYEAVAELLWTGQLPAATEWAPLPVDDRQAIEQLPTTTRPITRIAMAAQLLGDLHPDDDSPTAARRLLAAGPILLGATRRTGPFAHRLATAWTRRPAAELVGAVDRALILLADHGLATSTLAVRVAASARTSPYAALAAGLAAVDGELHGSASALVHDFLAACERNDPGPEIEARRERRELIPGFGHKVYRRLDPRVEPLMEAVRAVAPADRLALVDHTVEEVGRRLPTPPNVDLALGALTWTTGLDPHFPIFAVARIAGWAAHCQEEFAAPPLRFRGLANRPG